MDILYNCKIQLDIDKTIIVVFLFKFLNSNIQLQQLFSFVNDRMNKRN